MREIIYKGGIYLNHSAHGMARLNLEGDNENQMFF